MGERRGSGGGGGGGKKLMLKYGRILKAIKLIWVSLQSSVLSKQWLDIDTKPRDIYGHSDLKL